MATACLAATFSYLNATNQLGSSLVYRKVLLAENYLRVTLFYPGISELIRQVQRQQVKPFATMLVV